ICERDLAREGHARQTKPERAISPKKDPDALGRVRALRQSLIADHGFDNEAVHALRGVCRKIAQRLEDVYCFSHEGEPRAEFAGETMHTERESAMRAQICAQSLNKSRCQRTS